MSESVGAAYLRASRFTLSAIEEAISKYGPDCTYEHIMAHLAEKATRELPEGTHYLRNAVSEADACAETDRRAQKEWELARESGFFSQPHRPVRGY